MRLPNTASMRFEGADAEAVVVHMDPVAVSAGSACNAGSIEPFSGAAGDEAVPASGLRVRAVQPRPFHHRSRHRHRCRSGDHGFSARDAREWGQARRQLVGTRNSLGDHHRVSAPGAADSAPPRRVRSAGMPGSRLVHRGSLPLLHPLGEFLRVSSPGRVWSRLRIRVRFHRSDPVRVSRSRLFCIRSSSIVGPICS